MKKIVFTRTGDPSVLEVRDCPEPQPRSGEVLVDIKAVGLNWSEVMTRRGEWPVDAASGFTPGAEGAGIAAAVGEDVRRVRPGDRVAVFDVNAYLDAGQGAYAEKIVVEESKVLNLPSHLSFAQAAAAPMALLTAYDALIKHTPLPETGTLIVTACTGAVGIAALQIGKMKNLRVIGSTRSPDKAAKIEALGCEAVVAADAPELSAKLLELLDGAAVDYVFDPLQGAPAAALLPHLGFNGAYVVYGALAGRGFQVPESFLFQQVRIHGYVVLRNLADPARLQQIWAEIYPLLEDDAIRIPVAGTFPLLEAAAAHRAFESHTHFGKLVLVR